ncbi:hypothetical protein TSUD_50440 [Trifolium subterraneum]|uniref:Uncharacterized protein n=1 Tax=Trifolium subterraneum TaxID=3900 RepID=A0A2Z6LWW2_TRISU|nr:hypothetical protein TSUD_50440 [Trifolium subterraneum]
MKRQRGASVNNAINTPKNPPNVEDMVVATMGKKKGKKEGEHKMKEEVEKKESKEMSELSQQATITTIREGVNSNVMTCNLEEYMPWLGGVVDEQMSWGSTWFPGWDMDFMGESFNSLYSDVVWEDDIWNLKNEIPIPVNGKRFELE